MKDNIEALLTERDDLLATLAKVRRLAAPPEWQKHPDYEQPERALRAIRSLVLPHSL